MKSIRSHLFVLLLSALGVLCCAGGWASCHIVRKMILKEFDYSLKTKAHDLFMLTEWKRNRYEFEFSEREMPEFKRLEHPEYYEVRLLSGEVLDRSPSLGVSDLSLPDQILSDSPQVYNLILPGGLPGRAAIIEAMPLREGSLTHCDEEAIIIILARDTVRLNQVFRHLIIGFSFGTLVILLIMVISVKWVVSSGLKPLDHLAARTVTIQPDALDVRFPASSMPVELQPIANQLNDLLQRMDLAFQRERYLTASMAHELYTPIAELRSMSEVVLKWPEDRDPSVELAKGSNAIALQMQALVDALLSLSRCESGLQEVQVESVDVASLLEDLRASSAGKIEEKEVKLTWEVGSARIVETDSVMLSSVLGNLFKNAVEYTPKQGAVHCRVDSVPDGCNVILTNTNTSLTKADLDHVCEPLWRKDTSRTGTFHSGFGLAVAERFSGLLGIQLSVSLPTPESFQACVAIPSSVPHGPRS